MDPLVSTAWLTEHLDRVRVVDASYYLAEHSRDARAEFAAGHIPGAMFLDLGTLADPASPLPMTLPPAAALADRLGQFGIASGDRIVLYDASPIRPAARAWWMLRMAGIADVEILDGGFAKWRAEGRETTAEHTPRPPAPIAPVAPLATRASFETVRAIVAEGGTQIVDARSPARFAGTEPETRPGIAPGHIPGSRNLHYTKLFESDGTWKRPHALAAAFADAGIDPSKPAVATCGSGVTAALLVFAAHLLGYPMSLYDGSWTEWGGHPDTAKALGEAS